MFLNTTRSHSPGTRTHDYESMYQRDKQGDEATENARIWNVYLDEAEGYDSDMIDTFLNTVDSLLVFATIFSAVVANFASQSCQSLQPDNGQIMASLLYENNQLMRAAGSGASVDTIPKAFLVPGSRTHSSVDIWVNGLFFTSLALSLSTVLLTVIAKQWIQAYTVAVAGSPRTRALIRHFRFKGLMKYRFPEVIERLPLILHCSVFIFFIGLALYLSQRSLLICGVFSAITTLTLVFGFGTSIFPAFDIACPYRIPFISSLAKPLVLALRVARYAYFGLPYNNTLARPLVSAFRMAGYPYFKLRDILIWIKDYEMWPEGSLAEAEHRQVFHSHDDPWGFVAASRACEAIAWVFNKSSNISVKNIVVEAVCALLEEWNSKDYSWGYFRHVVSMPEHSDLFLSATTHSLSQLSEVLAQSATERDLEESTCVRLFKNLMKISFTETLFGGDITILDNWLKKIEPLWISTYEKVVRSRQHALSRRLLDWGQPMLQSERNHEILFACARWGDEEDIRDLVDRGMNLNLRDAHGWTALHVSASNGNLNAVIALSQRVPSLMSQASGHSREPRTALEVAIDYCKPDVVAYLFDHGAQAPPDAFQTAMRLEGLQADERLAIVQFLLDHGHVTTEVMNRRTPIDVVHDPAIIKYLENYPDIRLSSPSESPASLTSSDEDE
ncbi:hypothetical protein C0993_011685 [Termitomyces sp. T159_Od127]|nr:hypothetical protein C0993_011685 [Termitomyces sp. T159_Od127]